MGAKKTEAKDHSMDKDDDDDDDDDDDEDMVVRLNMYISRISINSLHVFFINVFLWIYQFLEGYYSLWLLCVKGFILSFVSVICLEGFNYCLRCLGAYVFWSWQKKTEDDQPKLSKKKLRKMNRLSVAELKQVCVVLFGKVYVAKALFHCDFIKKEE